MSYLHQIGAKKRKKRKKKQFLSNYAKHLSICNWIKSGSSNVSDSLKGGLELLLEPDSDCFLNGPVIGYTFPQLIEHNTMLLSLLSQFFSVKSFQKIIGATNYIFISYDPV